MRYLLVALISLFSSSLFSAENIEFAVGEWKPLVSEKSPGNGIIPSRLEPVFNAMGIKATYRFFPWSRAYKQVIGGQFLLSVGWIKNKERTSQVVFSKRPIYQTETALFHLKNRTIKFESFKDLVGLKIGITRDYAQGAEFSAAIKEYGLTVEVASSDELNMKKLLSGRIDVFPIDRSVGYELIKQILDPVEHRFIIDHPKAVARESLWLIGTKGNAKALELIERFNKEWKGIKNVDTANARE